ncbi:calcium-binding protein, partial [Roseomonas sp. 18066]|uniref:calcium-binding protein n=1 Tax=Roseomonas sp. 18066 TaxID=2681412 RepID=UPI00272CA7D6
MAAVNGTDGDDVIPGAGSNDTFNGSLGNDSFNGGTGNDVAVYGATFDRVTLTAEVTFQTNSVSAKAIVEKYGVGGAAVGEDTLINVDKITATSGLNDTVSTPLLNQPDGAALGANIDLTTGLIKLMGTYNNRPIAGPLAATIISIDGFEHVTTTVFADKVTGNAAANRISTYAGDDVIDGNGGDDIIDGGAGNDTIDGGAGNDTIIGTLSGSDTIKGGLGVDTLDYTSAGGPVAFGLGEVTSGGEARVTIDKGLENGIDSAVEIEVIIGSAGGGDAIDGRTLDALPQRNGQGAGASLDVDLGAGSVRIDFANSAYAPPLSGSLAYSVSGFEIVEGSARADTITGGTSETDLTLRGNDGDDILTGGLGDDTIEGGAGDDTIHASLGDDTISGGTGFDTLNYASLNDADDDFHIHVDLMDGTVRKHGDDTDEDDDFSGIEKIIATSNNDYFDMGAGAIEIDGGEGFDTVYYDETPEAQDGLTISLDGSVPSDGIAAGHKFTNIERVVAGSGDDWVIGDVTAGEGYYEGVDNVLEGRDGDDVLDGGFGDDVLI